jgi:hypothetical protein
MLLLEEIDTSALTALVVQYNDNDHGENRAFVDAGFHLTVMERAEYENLAAEHARLGYYPGKYLHRFLPLLLTPYDPSAVSDATATPAAETDAFLAVLSHAAPRLGRVPIVVIELNGFASNDASFVDEVRLRVDDHPGPLQIETVDLSSRLGPEHFLPIDGHLNDRGHAVVAGALVEALPR